VRKCFGTVDLTPGNVVVEEMVENLVRDGLSVSEKRQEQVMSNTNSAVFNLGSLEVTTEMEDLLGLGLKYVPAQRINKSIVAADIERLRVRLMWTAYWKWKIEIEGEREQGEVQQTEGLVSQKESVFDGRVQVAPEGLPHRWQQGIEKYCEAIKEDIYKGLKRKPKDNMSEEQREVLETLQEKVRKKEWAIRPADKGGGITIERHADMVEDGLMELQDETTFVRIEKSDTGVTIRRVEEKLKDMMAREVITKRMRHFLSAKNTSRKNEGQPQGS
jgi:hypothetical protein